MTAITTNGDLRELAPVSNDAEALIHGTYRTTVTLRGTTPLLFHRWSVEGVAEKAGAAKGSKSKKTDAIDTYVWRLDNGNLGLPGEYLRQSIIGAARYRQDPRSPRKSAMDLYKAALLVEPECADLGKPDWDYVDQRRVTVQRNGITRSRPAINAGWQATLQIQVLLPEYVPPDALLDVLNQAGRLVGLADFRPTYGRFSVVHFEVISGDA